MMPRNMYTLSTAPAKKHTGSAAELPTAIILASGLSTRMGCCKQLRLLYGKPLIQYTVETLLKAGIMHLVITVNAETRQPITKMMEAITEKQTQKHPMQNAALQEAAVEENLSYPFHCDIVFNPEPERGQGHSTALAVQAACARYMEALAVQTACRDYAEGSASTTVHSYSPSGLLFCTADQPFLQADSIRNLCTVFQNHPDHIVSAAFNGKHCSPVIFPAALAGELSRLDGRIGGRTVMNAHPDLILYPPLRSEMEAFDIDTPENFKQAEKYLQQPNAEQPHLK